MTMPSLICFLIRPSAFSCSRAILAEVRFASSQTSCSSFASS